MDHRILLLLTVFTQSFIFISADGPVYGGEQETPPAPSPSNGNLITQTVYGFLDFTTTIGNTVMVFSPQSAPVSEAPKTEGPITDNIIETKPPADSVVSIKPEVIKPSKIVEKENAGISNSGSPKTPSILSSVVNSVTGSDSSKPIPKLNKSIITKVEVVAGPSKVFGSNAPKPSSHKVASKPNSQVNKLSNKIISSKVELKEATPASVTPKLSSVIQVISSNNDEEEPAVLITNNNIGDPEYDFLSRQPSEFVEETYKLINVRPSKALPPKPKLGFKNKAQQRTPPPPDDDDDDEHPIGLVTTLGGTIVKDGITTIHETSVIGTYISGKYAQVLNSNSKIIQPSGFKPKIAPTPTTRILKTPAPAISKHHKYNLEPTPAASLSDESVISYENSPGKASRRPPSSGTGFKNRNRSHNNSDEGEENQSNQSKKYKNRNSSNSQRNSESASPSFSNRRKNSRSSVYKASVTPANNIDSHSRRGFKPRVQPSAVEPATSSATTSLYKFKLNRAPGRWQYKTTPKPRVTIRKIMGDDDSQTTPNTNPLIDDPQSNDVSPQSRSDNDLELSGSHSGPGSLFENDNEDNSIEKPPPVETLKVEISTPADFKDVYYEIATIKSPYTFQVGRVKNTRIITVTSTFTKSIEPTYSLNPQSSLNEPLTENILATASPYEKDHNLLDSSIATLPPITLSSDMETPPLETITETFSTTQNLLKTHILPVIREPNITSSLTFIQTYHITRFVTATKTLPPMDFYQFIPSKTLKEFNSRLDEAGSELHLELDFGDSNEDEEGVPHRAFPPDLDLANIGSDFDLSEVDKYRMPDNHLRLKKAHGPNNNVKAQQVTEPPTPPTPALTPEQAQQLALLRLLNPAAAAQIPNVVTTSKPVLKYETVYESHVIPYFDGKSSVYSTISRPVATITKTEYEIGTSSLPALPLQPFNPLFPQQPVQVQSTPVIINTQITATESQVLKLTFGAKTVYTTLYNTKIIPTILTSYITQSIVAQPSAGYPGYFPAPFAPFPYVG